MPGVHGWGVAKATSRGHGGQAQQCLGAERSPGHSGCGQKAGRRQSRSCYPQLDGDPASQRQASSLLPARPPWVHLPGP